MPELTDIIAALDCTSWPSGTPRPVDSDIRLFTIPTAPIEDCEHSETICIGCLADWSDYEVVDGPAWAKP